MPLGTLDLIVTFSEGHRFEAEVDLLLLISDHACVSSVHALPHSMSPNHQRLVWRWCKIDCAQFSKAIKESLLGTAMENSNVDDIFDIYNALLHRTGLAVSFVTMVL